MATEVKVRAAQEADLVALEWSGMFTLHREVIRSAYAQHLHHDGLFFVADVEGVPVGQVWVDMKRYAEEGAGLLWALRVHPHHRGHGIGTALIQFAERALCRRKFAAALIEVETSNAAARRLYERLGYRIQGQHPSLQGVWLLRKRLPLENRQPGGVKTD